MIALSLLGLAAALIVGGAQLRRIRLFDALPRLGVLTWQALSFAAVAGVVLAGLTLVVPASSMGGDLSSLLRACVFTLQAAYAAPTELPGVTAGVVIAAGASLWPAGWILSHLHVARRERRTALDALALVSRDDAALVVTVVDTDVAAAYCLPGRHGRIVLTTATVRGLDRDELAAVIAHERAHLRERHHIAVAALRSGWCAPLLAVHRNTRRSTAVLLSTFVAAVPIKEINELAPHCRQEQDRQEGQQQRRARRKCSRGPRRRRRCPVLRQSRRR